MKFFVYSLICVALLFGQTRFKSKSTEEKYKQEQKRQKAVWKEYEAWVKKKNEEEKHSKESLLSLKKQVHELKSSNITSFIPNHSLERHLKRFAEIGITKKQLEKMEQFTDMEIVFGPIDNFNSLSYENRIIYSIIKILGAVFSVNITQVSNVNTIIKGRYKRAGSYAHFQGTVNKRYWNLSIPNNVELLIPKRFAGYAEASNDPQSHTYVIYEEIVDKEKEIHIGDKLLLFVKRPLSESRFSYERFVEEMLGKTDLSNIYEVNFFSRVKGDRFYTNGRVPLKTGEKAILSGSLKRISEISSSLYNLEVIK